MSVSESPMTPFEHVYMNALRNAYAHVVSVGTDNYNSLLTHLSKMTALMLHLSAEHMISRSNNEAQASTSNSMCVLLLFTSGVY